MGKRIILIAMATIVAFAANAYDFMADGLCYNINSDSTSVSVTSGYLADGTLAYRYVGDIIIPESVTYEGNSYPVTSIGERAFYCCTGVTSVIIPNSVTSIGVEAFNSCYVLASVTIPNSIKVIPKKTFRGCNALTSIALPNSITYIGEEAFFGTGLKSLTLPNTATLFYNAFSATSITTLTIVGAGPSKQGTSEGLTASLETLNIGSGITALGQLYAAPAKVYCYAEVPPTCDPYSFKRYDAELHVPSSATAAYFSIGYWRHFSNVIFDANEKVTMSQNEAAMTQWDELALTATVNSSTSTLKWSTSDPSVAIVNEDGVVTAIGGGECDIFATMATNDAVYASCHVTVSYPEVSLELSESNVVLAVVGEQATLTATVTPDNTGLKPKWTSTDTNVATVVNGVVTAKGVGECDIVVTLLDASATCHVTVSDKAIITLSLTEATIQPSKILTLYPTCTPDIEVDFKVTSSDTSVALARIVLRNESPAASAPALAATRAIQVVGIKEGVATITVGSTDGKVTPATCVVTVVSEEPVVGDFNGDGVVTVSDVNLVVSDVLLNGNNQKYDINGDGQVNVSDINLVVSIVLNQ